MLYKKDNNLFDEENEVIKLEIKVNEKHYPNFPKEVFVSEFNYQKTINSLMGLDSSVRRNLNLSDDEFYKTWIAFEVKVTHTKDDKYFGVNGNTLTYKWI